LVLQESASPFNLAVSAHAKFAEGRRNYLRWLFANQVLGQIAQVSEAYIDIPTVPRPPTYWKDMEPVVNYTMITISYISYSTCGVFTL